MGKSNKLFNFIVCANYSDDNLNYIRQQLNKNNNQLIRDTFEILNSIIHDYNGTEYYAQLIYNSVTLIKTICDSQKFNDEEIQINKKRIKKARGKLFSCSFSLKHKEQPLLTNSINLLDEIVLDKNIDPEALIKLLKELINNQEEVNIIKKFVSINKEALSKSIELFDYTFKKAIDAIENQNRDIFYYITLLKIFYVSRINKNKYLAMLLVNGKNEHSEEIKYIINGNKRPYNTDEILEKYNINLNPSMSKVITPYNKTLSDKIITIDRNKTYLRDDAISIKKDGNKYIVSIHVADVGASIVPFSTIDYEAKSNFKGLYLPNQRIGIFNEKIEDKLSLNKGKLRNVITLNVVLNDSGEIIDYDISENVISVSSNISYTESDRILRYESGNELYESLNDLFMISSALAEKNKKKAEYWKKKEEANKEQKIKKYKSDTIIGELMVLYNRLLAVKANDEKMPYLYRIQYKEYISSLMKELSIEINGYTKSIINGLYLDSKYSLEPKEHAGLDYPIYSHSSDPLRRYTDTYNQYLYHEFCFKDIKPFYDEEYTRELINYCNQRNRELSLMKAEYKRALEIKK